jgi:hypothetical protein
MILMTHLVEDDVRVGNQEVARRELHDSVAFRIPLARGQ